MTDLSNYLGVPLWGTMIAGLIIWVTDKAEDRAEPRALQEIGLFIRNSPPVHSINIAKVILAMFEYTFGQKHLTRVCITRSVIASITPLLLILLVPSKNRNHTFLVLRSLATHGMIHAIKELFVFVVGFIFLCAIPDYISLAKTRIIIVRLAHKRRGLILPALVVVDASMSILIWGFISIPF